MKDIQRRLAKLEAGRPEHPVDPEASAAAYAQLTEVINGLAAAKAAGDDDGTVNRQIGEFLAALEHRP